MVSQTVKIDSLHESTLERIDELKMATSGNSSELRQLTDQMENLDNKSRKKSIVVDGLPEKDNDVEAKDTLVGFIQKVIPDFLSEHINVFYRVGKLQKLRKVRAKQNPLQNQDQNVTKNEEQMTQNETPTPTNRKTGY